MTSQSLVDERPLSKSNLSHVPSVSPPAEQVSLLRSRRKELHILVQFLQRLNIACGSGHGTNVSNEVYSNSVAHCNSTLVFHSHVILYPKSRRQKTGRPRRPIGRRQLSVLFPPLARTATIKPPLGNQPLCYMLWSLRRFGTCRLLLRRL